MRTTILRPWARMACALLAACGGVSCAAANSTSPPAAPDFMDLADAPEAGGTAARQPETVSSCLSATATGAAPDLHWPAQGEVTSGFGERGRRPHDGIDISGYVGRAVRAAADGVVVFSERKRGYGRVVILDHGGGYSTLYAHNWDNLVWNGVNVKRGRVIAEMGTSGRSSGPHLHFEVLIEGRPVDPLTCLPSRDTLER